MTARVVIFLLGFERGEGAGKCLRIAGSELI